MKDSKKNEPTFPKNWTKTTDDLFKNSKKVYKQELDWAYAYELSLIPKHYQFAKQGAIYEARENQLIDYVTLWNAPYTGGGLATLFKGECIKILSPTSKTLTVAASPLNYNSLENRIIDQKILTDLTYRNFYFNIPTKELNTHFKRLS